VYVICTRNVYCTGTLTFGPGEVYKTFSVVIIDDDIFEEDEHFLCTLSNLRLAEVNGEFKGHLCIK